MGGSSGSGFRASQTASARDSEESLPWLAYSVAEFWIADSQEWEEVVVGVVDVVEDGRWRWVTLSAFVASSVLTLFFVFSSL